MTFKPVGEIARPIEKKLRHRRWHWSRHFNGFCDKPLWRVAAVQLGVPLTEIVAFVMRLEEFANAADQRGQVHHFVAAEFAAALDIPTSTATQIFEELERVGWVKYGAVGDFHDRNRDEEKEAVNERKRRERGREAVRKLLSELSRLGLIETLDRNEIEANLYEYTSVELDALKKQLRAAKLSTAQPTSRPSRVTGVTVTTEQSKIFEADVDNFGATTRGEERGPSEGGGRGQGGDPQETSRLWIETEGLKLLVERMEWPLTRASMMMARWLDQNIAGDAAALATILQVEDARGYIGPRFHTNVTDAIERHVRQAQARGDTQGRLPLGGIQPVKRSGAA